jgi:thiol-disulfide isomerase/thioredoxin
MSHSKDCLPWIAGLLGGLLLLLATPLLAQQAVWLTPEEDGSSRVHLYFFWSSSCPHCQQARPVIEAMAQENPWLELHSGNILADRKHVYRYKEMAASLGQQARSVPGFFICGQMFVGWDENGNLSRTLLQTAASCRDKGLAGIPEPELALPGGIQAEDYSLPLFTLVIAGLDAFNPCAFFILLFLLSLLVNARSRRRMLLVGGTFVLISGAVYFLFMAAWLNLFLLVGTLDWVNLAAGLLAVVIGLFGIKDFWFSLRGPSLSISTTSKLKLHERMRSLISSDRMPLLLSGTVLLAIVANSYELLCTAGFPMVYTRVLTMRQLGITEHYLYLLLYNLIYIIPLLLIVVAFVVTLGRRKLTLNEGRLLKLLSGTMMLALGAVLLLKPELLNNLWTGVSLLALAVTTTLLAHIWLKTRAN